MAATQVSIRIDLESGGRIGPGKIALLEAIRKAGSIKAAARSMQMSYPKACILVDELNNLMSKPVVTTAAGGAKGGGTIITPVGEKIIQLYRSIETHSPSCRAQQISGFSEIDARLSASREDLTEFIEALPVRKNPGTLPSRA